MQSKEEESPYEYLFLGDSQNTYGFETDNSIVYEVKFKNTSYIFDKQLDFPIIAFEFVILVALNPTHTNPPLDSKIPFTVAKIFKDFFEKVPEQVVIYICDSSDRRQATRKRKFDQWVDYFKGNDFVKINTTITDKTGLIYYNALIIRKDNPNRFAITEEQDK